MCPYTPPSVDAGSLESSYIALFKAGDVRAIKLWNHARDLVYAGLLTWDDVAKFANDVMAADTLAFYFNHDDYFNIAEVASILNSANITPSKVVQVLASPCLDGARVDSILSHENLGADRLQQILYEAAFNSELVEALTKGAGDLTVSSDTSISGVNRYSTLTVESGVTLTVNGQPGALIVKTLNNNGTIAKSPTGGSPGTAGEGGGRGGQGGGGIVIFASSLNSSGVIHADGEDGQPGSTTTTGRWGSKGGAGAFFRVGTDAPGTGGDGAYDSTIPESKGAGGVNGGGGGGFSDTRYGGDGDGSTLTDFSSYSDLADEIRKAVIDWVIVNIFGKSPTSTVSIPNVYGSGGGGGAVASGTGCCGGGGGGGGEILALCVELDNTGTIRANGGVGGDGGTEGAKDNEGGGGGGGIVYVLYKTLVSTGTLQADGGAAGTGDSNDTAAVAGAAGMAKAEAV